MSRSEASMVRACILGIACMVGTTLGMSPAASAQSSIQGDIDGDGAVGFSDLALLMANWQGSTPQLFGWGVLTPSVRAIHQLQVESVEETGCILVLDLDADYVSELLALPQKRRGIRALTRPGGWPAWPPPGSALEALMERATTDPESVERLAQQMLDALPPLPEGHQPPVNPENPDDPGAAPLEPPEPPPPEIPELPEPPPPEPQGPPELPQSPDNPMPGQLPAPA